MRRFNSLTCSKCRFLTRNAHPDVLQSHCVTIKADEEAHISASACSISGDSVACLALPLQRPPASRTISAVSGVLWN